jgi:hypothetical protein
MPPSERSPAQGEQDDDILERAPSHPVTTTLLIVSACALIIAIGVTTTELERYVNQDTRRDLDNFQKSAVTFFEETYGVSEEGAPEGAPRRRPTGEGAAPAEGQPAEQPAPAPTDQPAPAEGEGGNG